MPKSKEFVSSSESESGSDSDSEPKQKKKRPAPKKEVKKEEKRKEKKEEKEEKKSSGGAEKGPNGEYMFQLTKMRYATVSEFRGKVMVGIREFYEKDGQMLPGRKGISLPLDQWNKLKDTMEDIEEAIKELS